MDKGHAAKAGQPYRGTEGRAEGKTKTDEGEAIEDLAERKVLTISVTSPPAMAEVTINLRNSDSYESCIRNMFRYPCDADTVAAISGGTAVVIYGNTDVAGIDAEKTAEKQLEEILRKAD